MIGAFNRLELVCTGKTYDPAVGVMAAAGPDLLKPETYTSAITKVGEASRTYREAAKAELRN